MPVAETEIWQPGMFRPLLHHVPVDARVFDFHGLPVRFSVCGCPTVPTRQATGLDDTAHFCLLCLASGVAQSAQSVCP